METVLPAAGVIGGSSSGGRFRIKALSCSEAVKQALSTGWWGRDFYCAFRETRGKDCTVDKMGVFF
jgi:hypothetical protein